MLRSGLVFLLAGALVAACGLSVVGIDLTSDVDAGQPEASSPPPVTTSTTPPIVDAGPSQPDADAETPPTITLSGSAQTTTIDFTEGGTSDWAYWGGSATPPFERKADGGMQIRDYTMTPLVTPLQVSGTTMSWTDGTAPTPLDLTATNVEAWYAGPIFTFTVPALPASQTLVLYVGGDNSDADFVAKIGDATSRTAHASDFATTTAVYTIRFAVTFSSPTPANLEVTWSLSNACDGGTACGTRGFYALNGATLSAP